MQRALAPLLAPRGPQGGPYAAEFPSRFAPVSASAVLSNGMSATPFKVLHCAALLAPPPEFVITDAARLMCCEISPG